MSKQQKYILTIPITILLCMYSRVNAQDSIRSINFRVINEITGSPVELAHVINPTKKDATISDLLGYFKMSVGFGDTLTIASLGYFKKEVINWGQYGNDSTYYTIKLKPRSYELKNLEFKWFSNYESFLKGFLELKLPVTKEEVDLERIRNYFSQTIRRLDLKNLPSGASGGSFGIDWLAKQNQDLKEKLEKERKQRTISRKFSAGIVEAITGLKGNEAFWFMEYCGFTDEYILKSSDYEIRLRILDKHKVYNQDKELKDKK